MRRRSSSDAAWAGARTAGHYRASRCPAVVPHNGLSHTWPPSNTLDRLPAICRLEFSVIRSSRSRIRTVTGGGSADLDLPGFALDQLTDDGRPLLASAQR